MALVTLLGLAKKAQERVDAIDERELEDRNDDSDEGDLLQGNLTAAFEANSSFHEFTGYSRELIAHWVDLMVPHETTARKRGPMPKSSLSDALLCYLVFLHIDADHAQLAKAIGIGESQFSGNLTRIRPIFNAAMREKWPNLVPRPLHDNLRPMPAVGLLVDTTTVECYRPKARFADSKIYFDGHNWIYGLKIEVAVTSARPHVAVYQSAHQPGSISDYTIHKANFHHYLPYLAKNSLEERNWGGNESDHEYWAILGDKMYVGPAADTPNERRITPMKRAQTQQQKQANKEKNKARQPVEDYFGHLYRKNGVFNHVYRHDHSNFDMDFENACWLTNEDISINALTLEDGEFYQKLLDSRVENWKNEEKKRKASYQKQKQAKKQKLQKVQKYVSD